jgi:hypothetical protein
MRQTQGAQQRDEPSQISAGSGRWPHSTAAEHLVRRLLRHHAQDAAPVL